MKRFSMAGLGVALMVAMPLAGSMPGLAILKTGGESAIAQSSQKQAPVQLRLIAAKRVIEKDAQGNQKTNWKPLEGNISVAPGEVLRWTVKVDNGSNRPVKNFIVTQPIPRNMVYVPNSATLPTTEGATLVYSIDGSKSFVAKPTVKVKLSNGKVETRPAPAETYTHIRWNFGQKLAPKSTANATYEVKVR